MSSILDELKYKYPDTEGVQKANNIAEGVAAMPTGGSGGVMVVNDADGTLDKTWQEIRNVAAAGGLVYVKSGTEGLEDINVVLHIGESADENYYSVDLFGDISFTTSSPSGHPTTVSDSQSPQDVL